MNKRASRMIAMMALAIGLLRSTATSADSGHLQYVGSALWTEGRDMWVEGSVAYFVLAPGLLVLNVADPTTPDTLAQLYLPDGIWAACKNGDFLYLGTDLGLRILDVSNPSSPISRGSLSLGGEVRGLFVQDTIAYVAAGTAGLIVVNVADVYSPDSIGHYPTGYRTRSVVVVDTLAYFADDFFGGLQIVNVVDPTEPLFVGKFDTPSSCWGVAVDDTLAYLADDWSGFHVVSVANPAAPYEIGTIDYDVNGRDMFVIGTTVFAHDYGDGVYAFDVANPSSPQMIGHYDTYGGAYGMFISGTIAFVADSWAGAVFLDVSQPASIDSIGGIPTDWWVTDVDIDNQIAVVASRWTDNTNLVDISDPAAPVKVGSYPIRTWGLYVRDTLAWLATADSGLLVLNIADPTQPVSIGYYPTTWGAWDVWLLDTIAYLAYEDLTVLNIIDPTAPTYVGSWQSGVIYPERVCGNDSLVLLGGETSEYMKFTQLLDVSDPTTPTPTYTVGGYAGALRDTIAYTIDYNLEVTNVADPSNPVLLDELDPNVTGSDIVLNNGLAFLAAGYDGVFIVDVTDPTNIAVIGHYDTPGNATRMAYRDSLLYVADRNALVILRSGPCCANRGNVDHLVGPGGPIDVADLTYLVSYLFGGGAPPPCEEEGNVDGIIGAGGPIDVADLTYLVAYLFLGGPAPAPCP